MSRMIPLNKPYAVLPQFTQREGRPPLADDLPIQEIYPAGRLDRDSEGLLLLTDNGDVQHRLANPKFKNWKSYWVQVEGIPSEEALRRLIEGMELKDGPTRPAQVKVIDPPELWPRTPPVRYRAKIPTQWLEIRIREGR
ncbi:MAG: pseudouridine synthase, partial [bacterium]|nr:pseudouridine synthase [bacterium]